MSKRDRQQRVSKNWSWLALAGAGSAAALYAVWAARKSRKRPGHRVGAHAWLVPTGEARTEGRWTQQAVVHTSESKA